jgi:hypothetical protein
MTNTESLAKDFNVSESDLVNFAKMIASSLTQDGVNADQVEPELVQAYAIDQVKKTERFHSTYLTNSEARITFQRNILESLK